MLKTSNYQSKQKYNIDKSPTQTKNQLYSNITLKNPNKNKLLKSIRPFFFIAHCLNYFLPLKKLQFFSKK